jgi:hypothetical protein
METKHLRKCLKKKTEKQGNKIHKTKEKKEKKQKNKNTI